MASTGLRTLCLAYTDFEEADPSRPDDFFEKPHGLEANLTALCIVGIKVGAGRGGRRRRCGAGWGRASRRELSASCNSLAQAA